MAIDFPKIRWEKIERDYTAWWKGRLDRPLIHIELWGKDSGMEKPKEPIYSNAVHYDFSVSPKTIVKHWEYMISCKKYVGDGFPNMIPDFGPGVNAAFMGAKPTVTPETVWFEAEEKVPMKELHFQYNSQEPWLKRIKEIYQVAGEYFQGSICLGMTHLNNGIDPVARFFRSEDMALAFYDHPESLQRLIWENHELCFRYYHELIEAMGPFNPGYTCWGYMFSKEPHFMWQSDFSAMIGPDTFRQFILPELEACCQKVSNSFYHLDGPGELPHLDMILDIPELKGVQWIPGAGQPGEKYWPEVYRRIRDAGKLIQLFGDLDVLDTVADQLGSAKGIYYYGSFPISREDEVMRWMEGYEVTQG